MDLSDLGDIDRLMPIEGQAGFHVGNVGQLSGHVILNVPISDTLEVSAPLGQPVFRIPTAMPAIVTMMAVAEAGFSTFRLRRSNSTYNTLSGSR